MKPLESLAAKARSLTPKSVGVALLMGLALWVTGSDNPFDRVWSDLLTAGQRISASGEYVTIDLSERDISNARTPSALREVLAKRISAFQTAGVKRILLDLSLAEEDGATLGDLRLSKAFSDFGRDKIGFAQTNDRSVATSQLLVNSATILDLGLLADHDGYFRKIRLQASGVLGNPAIWLASGRFDHRSTPIDLRLDPASVPSFSLDEVSRADVLARLRGKNVIIGLSQAASRSRASLPVHGGVDRSRLFALSAESYAENAEGRLKTAGFLGLGLALASLGAGLTIGARIPSLRTCLLFLPLLLVSAIAGCAAISLNMGAPAHPVTTVAVGLVGLMVALAFRLRLPELIGGLFAGDLSPEEAWLWRSYVDQDRPVLIFSASGAVRRSNASARKSFQLLDENNSDRALRLARQCMPGIGSRAVALTTGEGVRRRWRIEWPHASIPLAVFFDITDQVSKEEDLRRQLITDPLTGLRNRAGFDAELESLDLARGDQFALFYLDMNGFKEVNDTLGHDAGDELLSIVARRFEAVVRDGDVLARLGGDEFGLCVRGAITEVGAQRLAKKLQMTLGPPISLAKGEVQVGVAVGFGLRVLSDVTTDEVIRRADQAMYLNKKALRRAGATRRSETISP